MKRIFLIYVLVPLLALLGACSFTSTNSDSANTANETDQVTLTFVQHTFIRFSYNGNKENDGYYFLNDELAITSIKYVKGHNLSYEDIDNFNASSLNYELPHLEGDGYWSFTFFTTFFDENSGFSSDFLEPCVLDKDLTLHFAIYG